MTNLEHADVTVRPEIHRMSTAVIERKLSSTRDAREFDELITELELRLEARGL